MNVPPTQLSSVEIHVSIPTFRECLSRVWEGVVLWNDYFLKLYNDSRRMFCVQMYTRLRERLCVCVYVYVYVRARPYIYIFNYLARSESVLLRSIH